MLKGARQSALNRSVIIVGRRSLENKRLSDLIEERTGYATLIRSVGDLAGLTSNRPASTSPDV